MFRTLRAAATAALPLLSPATGFAQSATAVTVTTPEIIQDSRTGDKLCRFMNIASDVPVLLMPAADSKKLDFVMAAQATNGAKAYFRFDPNDETQINVEFRNIPKDGSSQPISMNRLGEIVSRYNAIAESCDRAYDVFSRSSAPQALTPGV